MQGINPCDPWSFAEYMQDKKDAKDSESKRCRIPGRIIRTRKKLIVYESAEEVAARLKITARRIRAMCSAGRIVGAKRQRLLPGKPWKIPLSLLKNGTYSAEVRSGTRGPKSRVLSTLVWEQAEQVPF